MTPARPASTSGPVRPAAPGAVGAPPPARPANHVAAGQPPRAAPLPPAPADPEAHERQTAQQADAVAHVVEDDDSVSVPPPPIEYLGHSHPHAPHGGGAWAPVPKYQSLEYRRTLIPVLLTTGLCLVVVGFTKWVCAPDTLLGAQPMWMTAVCFTLGALSFALGLLNMIQVKVLVEKARADRS
jgi:hypothetical protein